MLEQPTAGTFSGSNSGKVVGVIIPPPEIRLVVDKTALFVSRNGKSFEQRILASGEGKTAKFNFMKAFDPYHAYYEMKIREFEEKEAAGGGGTDEQKSQSNLPQVAEVPQAPFVSKENLTAPQPSTTTTAKSSVKAKASIVNPIAVAILQLGKPEELVAPPPLDFSLGHPTGINAVDIDIIKLTAQYTALNGREFLSGLAQREQRNPQFDFLKPTHVLFSYFTSLVDSYAKILQPSADQSERIRQLSQPKKALQLALQRWQYNRVQEERKKKENAAADEERLAFQSIDWQDFTVVETIDFPEDELFDVDIAPAPPLSALSLPGSAAAAAGNGSGNADFNRHVSQFADTKRSELSGFKPNALPPPPPLFKPPPVAPAALPSAALMPPPPPGVVLPSPSSSNSSSSGAMEVDEDLLDQDIKVVANYQPRIGGAAGKPLVMVDPISGKAIPVSQMEEHMRVQLLDPKWREEQKRFAEKQKETGYAEGSSIADSLKQFAKKRGDIFGQAAGGAAPDSAAAIAEEAAAEKRRQEEASAVQWDGHQGSISMTVKMKTDLLAAGASSSTVPAAPTPAPPTVGPFVPPALPPFAAPVPVPVPVPAPAPVPIPVPLAAPMPVPAPIPLPLPLPLPAVLPVPPTAPLPLPIAKGLPSVPVPIVPVPVPVAPYLPLAMPLGYMMPPGAMGAGTDGNAQEKKQRDLLPAEEFAARYPGPIRLSVTVGSAADMQTWNLQPNQNFQVNVSVNISVKELKELLSTTYLNGMPAGKQQLKVAEIGFLKDTSTLAALNIGDGATVEVSAKSRGGKK